MKKRLSALLILCLLLPLLSGCAGAPGAVPAESESPAPDAPDSGEIVVTPEPVVGPELLDLRFALPTADPRGEELVFYFSGADEFDCAFAYPSYCSVWVEKGAIRFDPGWFFARMFFSGVLRDAETAPKELLDLLEPGKWGSLPEEGEVGTGRRALRALNLKYDTWRDWIAWETPERYFLLYGACFDGREEVMGSIFETVAESFRTGDEMLLSAPESGATLRRSGAYSLSYDGAELCGGRDGLLRLRLRADNGGEEALVLSVSGYTADGREIPFDDQLTLSAGQTQVWTLSLPFTDGAALFETLELRVNAAVGGAVLFELPVQIELKK